VNILPGGSTNLNPVLAKDPADGQEVLVVSSRNEVWDPINLVWVRETHDHPPADRRGYEQRHSDLLVRLGRGPHLSACSRAGWAMLRLSARPPAQLHLAGRAPLYRSRTGGSHMTDSPTALPPIPENLRVSSSSHPAPLGGLIAKALRERGRVDLEAMGVLAVNQTVKALAVSRGYLAPQGLDATFQVSFGEAPGTEGGDGLPHTLMRFRAVVVRL
jgi:stage V sporulation protein S